MLTLCALLIFVVGAYGSAQVINDRLAEDRRKRKRTFRQSMGDLFWFCICLSMSATAAHSLAATWIN